MADTTQQMAAAEEKKEDAVPQQAKAHRMLQVSILRYNPADPDSVPHLQTYSVSETDSMTPVSYTHLTLPTKLEV